MVAPRQVSTGNVETDVWMTRSCVTSFDSCLDDGDEIFVAENGRGRVRHQIYGVVYRRRRHYEDLLFGCVIYM